MRELLDDMEIYRLCIVVEICESTGESKEHCPVVGPPH